MEYSFFAIAPKSVAVPVRIISMVQIELFNELTMSTQMTDVKLNC